MVSEGERKKVGRIRMKEWRRLQQQPLDRKLDREKEIAFLASKLEHGFLFCFVPFSFFSISCSFVVVVVVVAAFSSRLFLFFDQ